MELKRVRIQNYRSIKNENIYLNQKCLILVGINESGKSNVLDALSLMSDEYEVNCGDERELLPDEMVDNLQFEVLFVFDISKNIDEIYQSVLSSVACPGTVKILKNGDITYTLKQFCETFKEGLFDVNISECTKIGSRWIINTTGYEMLPGWKKPNSSCPADYSFNDNEDGYTLKDFSLIKPIEDWSIPAQYLEDATVDDVVKLIGRNIVDFVEKNRPSVIYWKYSENQLLPEKINLSEFISNSEKHIPLRNMFYLANINDIKSELQKAKDKGDTQLNNLLRRVAEKSTKYFQSVWKEYKNVKFSLRINGDFIQCAVTEHNDFAFNKRSDGFKRFVAFLLTVSSHASTGKLKNSLILVDEPDSGLHPSGARYLRDELIKISKDNIVVFSTHSIFMIDKENIARHLIIEKKNETTKTHVADEGNIVSEEVIFGALNYNIFEHLKPLNIIWEGWRDKKLMQIGLKNSEHKDFFKEYGIVNVDGVKSFKHMIPVLELAERRGLIISDADNPAKEKQKEYEKLHYKINWKRYDEILPAITAKTGEDFLNTDYLVSKVNQILRKHAIDVEIKEDQFPNSDRLIYLKEQLRRKTVQSTVISGILSELKDVLFEKLTNQSINESYYAFLSAIKQYIETNLLNFSEEED